MTEWTAVGIGGVVTAALTIVLALVFFPLFFLGPIIGGFLAVYLMKDEFESGIINGALAGVIGGLIIGILVLNLSVMNLAFPSRYETSSSSHLSPNEYAAAEATFPKILPLPI